MRFRYCRMFHNYIIIVMCFVDKNTICCVPPRRIEITYVFISIPTCSFYNPRLSRQGILDNLE